MGSCGALNVRKFRKNDIGVFCSTHKHDTLRPGGGVRPRMVSLVARGAWCSGGALCQEIITVVFGTAFMGTCMMVESRNDHTIMTAPLPVCSAKLSMIWLR